MAEDKKGAIRQTLRVFKNTVVVVGVFFLNKTGECHKENGGILENDTALRKPDTAAEN